ncbi:MAG: FadR family transcriptional regulator [Limnohabitans sp.]|nr:FadR family transcriptional regulator [Limnohabitans sp.]
MSDRPIEPQRLYRQIAKQIQTLISSGEFAVGSRLPAERDLATQLSVSRPSVREALIAMEVEGIIEVRTGSGIYVKSLGKRGNSKTSAKNKTLEWGPLEVLRARYLIEAEIAALAAKNATANDLKAMKLALKGMQKEATAGRVPLDTDIAFHMAIANACANSVMFDTLDRYLQARTGHLFERLGDYFESPASWAAAISEHEAVLQAIDKHDPQGARKAMQKHLRQAHKRFSASWRSAPSRS